MLWPFTARRPTAPKVDQSAVEDETDTDLGISPEGVKILKRTLLHFSKLYTDLRNYNTFVVNWDVSDLPEPPDDVGPVLPPESWPEPDFIVFGLQNCSVESITLWQLVCDHSIFQFNSEFVPITTEPAANERGGNVIFLYTRKELIKFICGKDCSEFNGTDYNVVAFRFAFHQSSFCFVNASLTKCFDEEPKVDDGPFKAVKEDGVDLADVRQKNRSQLQDALAKQRCAAICQRLRFNVGGRLVALSEHPLVIWMGTKDYDTQVRREEFVSYKKFADRVMLSRKIGPDHPLALATADGQQLIPAGASPQTAGNPIAGPPGQGTEAAPTAFDILATPENLFLTPFPLLRKLSKLDIRFSRRVPKLGGTCVQFANPGGSYSRKVKDDVSVLKAGVMRLILEVLEGDSKNTISKVSCPEVVLLQSHVAAVEANMLRALYKELWKTLRETYPSPTVTVIPQQVRSLPSGDLPASVQPDQKPQAKITTIKQTFVSDVEHFKNDESLCELRPESVHIEKMIPLVATEFQFKIFNKGTNGVPLVFTVMCDTEDGVLPISRYSFLHQSKLAQRLPSARGMKPGENKNAVPLTARSIAAATTEEKNLHTSNSYVGANKKNTGGGAVQDIQRRLNGLRKKAGKSLGVTAAPVKSTSAVGPEMETTGGETSRGAKKAADPTVSVVPPPKAGADVSKPAEAAPPKSALKSSNAPLTKASSKVDGNTEVEGAPGDGESALSGEKPKQPKESKQRGWKGFGNLAPGHMLAGRSKSKIKEDDLNSSFQKERHGSLAPEDLKTEVVPEEANTNRKEEIIPESAIVRTGSMKSETKKRRGFKLFGSRTKKDKNENAVDSPTAVESKTAAAGEGLGFDQSPNTDVAKLNSEENHPETVQEDESTRSNTPVAPDAPLESPVPDSVAETVADTADHGEVDEMKEVEETKKTEETEDDKEGGTIEGPNEDRNVVEGEQATDVDSHKGDDNTDDDTDSREISPVKAPGQKTKFVNNIIIPKIKTNQLLQANSSKAALEITRWMLVDPPEGAVLAGQEITVSVTIHILAGIMNEEKLKGAALVIRIENNSKDIILPIEGPIQLVPSMFALTSAQLQKLNAKPLLLLPDKTVPAPGMTLTAKNADIKIIGNVDTDIELKEGSLPMPKEIWRLLSFIHLKLLHELDQKHADLPACWTSPVKPPAGKAVPLSSAPPPYWFSLPKFLQRASRSWETTTPQTRLEMRRITRCIEHNIQIPVDVSVEAALRLLEKWAVALPVPLVPREYVTEINDEADGDLTMPGSDPTSPTPPASSTSATQVKSVPTTHFICRATLLSLPMASRNLLLCLASLFRQLLIFHVFTAPYMLATAVLEEAKNPDAEEPTAAALQAAIPMSVRTAICLFLTQHTEQPISELVQLLDSAEKSAPAEPEPVDRDVKAVRAAVSKLGRVFGDETEQNTLRLALCEWGVRFLIRDTPADLAVPFLSHFLLQK